MLISGCMKCVINELCNLKCLQCVITGRGKEEHNWIFERGQVGEAKRGRGQERAGQKGNR